MLSTAAGSAGSFLGGLLMDLNVDLPPYATAAVYLAHSALFHAALRGAEGR